MKTKIESERGIVIKVKNKVKKNIAMETKKRNKTDKPLSPDLLRKMNAYWRAANYLSVGQIYLYDNPLLRKPLKLSHVKPLVVGHWGTTPGQNFIYVHLNRKGKASPRESNLSKFPQHMEVPPDIEAEKQFQISLIISSPHQTLRYQV